MNISSTTRRSSLVIILLTVFSTTPSWASESVGKLIFTIGKVVIVNDKGQQKKAGRGMDVFQGDTVKTFSKGQAQIKFVDGARVSVRADSEFKVENYVYTKDENVDKSEMNLIRGGIRAVTGAIGKKNKKSYKLKTAIATIGIRGTDYSLMICQSSCKNENGERSSAGLYVGVISGGVTVTNKLGSLSLDQNQYGQVESFNTKPKMLIKPPAFLMFDKSKASSGDRHEFKKSFAKETRAQEKRSNKKQIDKSSPAHSDSDSSKNLPASIAKRVDGENAHVPTEVAARIKQQFKDNIEQLSDADRELFSELKDKLDDAESVEEIEQLFEEDGEKFSRFESFLDNHSGLPGSSDGCTGIIGSGCGTSSGVIDGGNPGSTDNPSSLQIIRLNRFFSSTLRDNDALQEYSLNVSADNRVQGFYHANSADTDLSNYIEFRPNTVIHNDYGFDPDTGLSWGRWSSANIDKTLHTLDGNSGEVLDFSQQSLHWVQGLDGSDTVHLPITGTRNFALVGNTRPTDNFGNIGTLGSASLMANFDTQSVDADVTLAINQQIWRAGQKDIPLNMDSGKFFGNQLNVEVLNAAGTTSGSGGYISGGLITSPSNGAAFNYSLDAITDGKETTVNGAAIFKEAQQ